MMYVACVTRGDISRVCCLSYFVTAVGSGASISARRTHNWAWIWHCVAPLHALRSVPHCTGSVLLHGTRGCSAVACALTRWRPRWPCSPKSADSVCQVFSLDATVLLPTQTLSQIWWHCPSTRHRPSLHSRSVPCPGRPGQSATGRPPKNNRKPPACSHSTDNGHCACLVALQRWLPAFPRIGSSCCSRQEFQRCTPPRAGQGPHKHCRNCFKGNSPPKVALTCLSCGAQGRFAAAQ